jgi:hypothetical protein
MCASLDLEPQMSFSFFYVRQYTTEWKKSEAPLMDRKFSFWWSMILSWCTILTLDNTNPGFLADERYGSARSNSPCCHEADEVFDDRGVCSPNAQGHSAMSNPM